MKFAPVLFGLLALALWEAAVRIDDVPVYELPGPIAILGAFVADPAGLLQALASTLFVTFSALLVAAALGGAMAVAMSASRLAQAAIQPWAVALQVTPLPAIAPLIIIWVGEPFVALVVCARLEMPRMFAALVLLALAGILLNFGLGALAQVILRRRG
jgi:NitT/TauT family transport system permease protein